MTNDDLKAFKISEKGKPTVTSQQARPKPNEGSPPPASAGFPRIEALVESAAPDLSGLTSRQAELEDKAKGKGSNKEKAGAKKAAAAYGKVLALIEYLLETKHKMAGGGSESSPR